MADWTPPPYGTPVWMAIPATDVRRAAEFYGSVFNLPFKKEQGAEHNPSDIRLFDFSPALSISGGILKVPEITGALSIGRGGVCLNWHVEDVDAAAGQIEKAGGKILSEKTKEGESGMYRYFEDTEGTVGAVYMMVKK